jgi:hypothetical protein
MKRPLLLASSLALMTACATPHVPTVEHAAQAEPVAITLPQVEPRPEAVLRQAGDYVVHRFTGSYRKRPVTLTQRVIERDGDVLVIDVTIEDGSRTKTLRVRLDDAPFSTGEILSVARLEGGVQRPFGVAAFDKLMNEVALGVDDNEGILDTRPVTFSLPNGEIACTRTTYRVRIGNDAAVMRTVSAQGFVWGDVAGEIRTEDGKLLYKTEIVDIGGPAASALVVHNGDEVYGELDDE